MRCMQNASQVDMRIGMILDAPYPTDPRVTHEAEALIAAGHEVFLFSFSYTKKFVAKETILGIQVRRYFCSKLLYKLSALAYTFPFYKIWVGKKIRHFIQKNAIRALHVHDLQVASAAFYANRSFSLPTVLDLHENRPEIMKQYRHVQRFPGNFLISTKRWKRAEERYALKATAVVVVTSFAKKELVNRTAISANKVIVMPNTVREAFYQDYPIQHQIVDRYASNFVLLYLGNTSERRGLLTVLDAIPNLLEHIPDLKLVIVGSSSFDNVLQKRVDALKISSSVDAEGWQPEQLFPSYILASDIGISPLHANLHHHTTYANKVFQYMSLGLPILVSNVKAQQYLIDTYNSGLSHEPKNIEDFCEKVIQLYSDKGLQETMATNGKNAILRNLNAQKATQELVSYYGK